MGSTTGSDSSQGTTSVLPSELDAAALTTSGGRPFSELEKALLCLLLQQMQNNLSPDARHIGVMAGIRMADSLGVDHAVTRDAAARAMGWRVSYGTHFMDSMF